MPSPFGAMPEKASGHFAIRSDCRNPLSPTAFYMAISWQLATHSPFPFRTTSRLGNGKSQLSSSSLQSGVADTRPLIISDSRSLSSPGQSVGQANQLPTSGGFALTATQREQPAAPVGLLREVEIPRCTGWFLLSLDVHVETV